MNKTTMKYIFNTKFSSDIDRNGEEIEIIEKVNYCQYKIKFVKDNTTLIVYDTEIKEVL